MYTFSLNTNSRRKVGITRQQKITFYFPIFWMGMGICINNSA